MTVEEEKNVKRKWGTEYKYITPARHKTQKFRVSEFIAVDSQRDANSDNYTIVMYNSPTKD